MLVYLVILISLLSADDKPGEMIDKAGNKVLNLRAAVILQKKAELKEFYRHCRRIPTDTEGNQLLNGVKITPPNCPNRKTFNRNKSSKNSVAGAQFDFKKVQNGVEILDLGTDKQEGGVTYLTQDHTLFFPNWEVIDQTQPTRNRKKLRKLKSK